MNIEFVVPSHNDDILKNNILKSSIFDKYKLTVQKGYTNICKAYNDAKVTSDVVVYLHHDVYLPDTFERDLIKSLNTINSIDPNWGVLGPAGILTIDKVKKVARGYVLDRGTHWGNPAGLPAKIDTLDELMLITHGDLKFDENIPGTHFYGADICMQAKLIGRNSYAIRAFCHHNSGLYVGEKPNGFLECQEYFRNKYIDYLPIATTCANIS